MIALELDQLARRLGAERTDVRRMLTAAARSPEAARIARNILRAKLRQAGIDPDDDDPTAVVHSPKALGGDGVLVGHALPSGLPFIWRFPEVPYSAIALGSPGHGKTTAVLNLVMQLSPCFPTVILDVRGDYECLLRAVPGARLFRFGAFPLNLLRGPRRTPPAVFNQRFSELFTDQFDAFQASRRYLNRCLDLLEARRVATGHWACLLDLQDVLENQREERGSDELRFRNRCLARVDAVRRALGEASVGVETGVDLEELTRDASLIVFRSELEKSITDFLSSWTITYLFETRAWSENKFSQKPLIIVLDEQRSILRLRR